MLRLYGGAMGARETERLMMGAKEPNSSRIGGGFLGRNHGILWIRFCGASKTSGCKQGYTGARAPVLGVALRASGGRLEASRWLAQNFRGSVVVAA